MFKTNRSTDYNKRQAIRSVGGELPSPFSTHDLRAFFFGAAAESRVYRFVIIKQACASTKPKMHLILNLRRIFVQKNKYASGIAGKLLPFHVFGNASLLTMSIIYGLLLLFIRFHAKKTEKPLQVAKEESGFEKNPRMDKALLYFACILGTGILLVLCSSFLPFLQAYTMIIVALMFLIGGLVAVSKSGMEKKKRWETFVSGVVSILPSILMILMASSIKYMMVEGKILDTMLHGAVQVASGLPKGGLILFIYLICLVMNFFIPSGSSKAFLLIPLIVPLAQIFGLRTQLCIVAFAFGDGFSNVFYPTNPALLISLSLGGVNYGEWAKYSAKFQGLNLILTSGILLLGLVLGY